MPKDNISVLIIEDDPKDLRTLQLVLRELLPETEIRDACSARTGITLCQQSPPDLVFLDLQLDPSEERACQSGFEVLRQLRPGPDIVVVSAFVDLPTMVRAQDGGAIRFAHKPIYAENIAFAIQPTLERLGITKLQDQLKSRSLPLPGSILKQIQMLAPFKANVLLLGESGVGKEVIAREIHKRSKRHPFVPVNVSTLEPNSIAGELFGSAGGRFTNVTKSPGLFEAAEGGTIFLDEIGDLPLDLQPKLFRFLEDGEVRRVGGNDTRKINVRVISATNRNLEEAVQRKEFRKELYFRLASQVVRVPTLCQRLDDIDWIVPHLMRRVEETEPAVKLFSFAPSIIPKLKSYSWPGNVRELLHVVQDAIYKASSEGGERVMVLPEHVSLPTQARRTDQQLGQGLSIDNKMKQNQDQVAWNQIRALEEIGLKTDDIGTKMGINKSTVFRLKAEEKEFRIANMKAQGFSRERICAELKISTESLLRHDIRAFEKQGAGVEQILDQLRITRALYDQLKVRKTGRQGDREDDEEDPSL